MLSCFVEVVVNVVVVVLIVVAIHNGLVVVDKSLSDTHTITVGICSRCSHEPTLKVSSKSS